MSDMEMLARRAEGQISDETRAALLSCSLSTRPDRRDRLPFAIMGALLVVGCAWLAGAALGAW